MPRYEYRCETNGQLLEISHGMNETVTTWGQLCKHAEIDPGQTPKNTPVEKVISLSAISTGSKPAGGPPGPCGAGCGCFPN